MEQDLPSMCSFSIIILALESHYSLNFSYLNSYVPFLIFPGTVITEEEDQVGPQAPEDPHDSSTDSCLTFPYSSNSPRPFPPSPVHSVTDSPIRVSPLFIATSNNSPVHRSIDHYSPAPTSPLLKSSQTFTSIPSSQITDPFNNPFYTPYFSSSFPQTGPIVFLGVLLNFLILESHFLGPVLLFLKLTLFLPILYLPWLLLLLNPFLSFLLDLSPHLVLGPTGDVVGVPEVLTLGGGGLLGAEEALLEIYYGENWHTC